MLKNIENIISGSAFADALRARGELAMSRVRLHELRTELDRQRALAEQVTSALETEITILEEDIEDQEEALDDAPALETAPTEDRPKSLAASVFGVLSVGFAVASFLAAAAVPTTTSSRS